MVSPEQSIVIQLFKQPQNSGMSSGKQVVLHEHNLGRSALLPRAQATHLKMF
jgi:hypothetical protein